MSNCTTHTDTIAYGDCLSCRQPYCARCTGQRQGSGFICQSCMRAAGYLPVRRTASAADASPDRRTRVSGNETVEDTRRPLLLLALLIVLLLYYAVNGKGDELRPASPDAWYNSTARQELALECYEQLYSMPSLLADNQLSAISAMTCPLHGQQYIIQQSGGDVIVIDPEPTALGYRDIRVSRNVGMPEFTPLVGPR